MAGPLESFEHYCNKSSYYFASSYDLLVISYLSCLVIPFTVHMNPSLNYYYHCYKA